MKEELDIKQQTENGLQEIRVVLPGTQALLGFQLSTFFTQTFDKLPDVIRYLHLVSLGCVGLGTILLMSPVAYNQVIEKGRATSENFISFTRRVLLVALFLLSIGLSLDLYVVAIKTKLSVPISAILSVSTFLITIVLWFGFTSFKKAKM